MADKDDYDRAWDHRLDRERLRESVGTAVSRSAVILIGLGLIFSSLGAEGLAIYNACFANPVCYPGAAGDGWEGFFIVLAAGLLLGEGGCLILLDRTTISGSSRNQTR